MDFENDINVDSLWLISERAKTGKHFLIAHPPYLDIVKFTEKPEDLSQISDIKIL